MRLGANTEPNLPNVGPRSYGPDMEAEIVSWVSAWAQEPVGVSVVGAVLAFLAVSAIKGTGRWLWSALTNVSRRLERWASRRQTLL